MRSLAFILLVLSVLAATSGAEQLYRRDALTGNYYPASSQAPASCSVSQSSSKSGDTTVVLTVHEGDTSKVVTIRKDDPLKGMDKSLRGIFGLQVTMVIVSVVSTVFTIIAFS
ncbi:MAG TPA: hypothetical protein VHO02_05800 [Fibrobacteria bacterium]|jgi:hypothetical protein|nr:hypothetical protein [Fibrobacteria bacterium]